MPEIFENFTRAGKYFTQMSLVTFVTNSMSDRQIDMPDTSQRRGICYTSVPLGILISRQQTTKHSYLLIILFKTGSVYEEGNIIDLGDLLPLQYVFLQ